jgi:hypothetical protein
MPKPSPVNPNQVFDIDNPNMELYESFTDKLKATISSAEEWGRKRSANSDFEEDVPWRDEVETLVDEVPF